MRPGVCGLQVSDPIILLLKLGVAVEARMLAAALIVVVVDIGCAGNLQEEHVHVRVLPRRNKDSYILSLKVYINTKQGIK